MRNRGLLTKNDRAFLRGERDVENPDHRRSDIKYNIYQRMEHIEEDLQILRDIGEDEIVADFYDRFGRASQLERRIAELERKLDEQDDV